MRHHCMNTHCLRYFRIKAFCWGQRFVRRTEPLTNWNKYVTTLFRPRHCVQLFVRQLDHWSFDRKSHSSILTTSKRQHFSVMILYSNRRKLTKADSWASKLQRFGGKEVPMSCKHYICSRPAHCLTWKQCDNQWQAVHFTPRPSVTSCLFLPKWIRLTIPSIQHDSRIHTESHLHITSPEYWPVE